MSKLSRLDKAENYGCDGNCYPDFGLSCPRASKCPETKTRELISLIWAYSLFIFSWILIVGVIICFFIKN